MWSGTAGCESLCAAAGTGLGVRGGWPCPLHARCPRGPAVATLPPARPAPTVPHTLCRASEDDIRMMLAAQVHVGSKNADASMARYIYKRRADGERPLRGPPGGLPGAWVVPPAGSGPLCRALLFASRRRTHRTRQLLSVPGCRTLRVVGGGPHAWAGELTVVLSSQLADRGCAPRACFLGVCWLLLLVCRCVLCAMALGRGPVLLKGERYSTPCFSSPSACGVRVQCNVASASARPAHSGRLQDLGEADAGGPCDRGR